VSKRFFRSDSRYGQAGASPKLIEIKKKEERQLNAIEVFGSVKKLFDETIEGSKTFLEEKNQFYPAIFLLLVFFAFLLAGGPLSVILPIAFFFIPAFLFFRFGLGQNNETSTVFAIPFAIAFDSIVFRISLLFSLSATTGWVSLAVGWIALFAIGLAAVRFFKIDFIKLFEDEQQVRTFRLYFLIVSFFAIIMYSQIFGPFTPERIFWGSHDANWQTSLLTYMSDKGTIEMPSYLCKGETGYDLDSFTSTTSIIPPYIAKMTGMLSSSAAQQSILYFSFMLMMQGIFVLFSKFFSLRDSLLSTIFAMFPLSIFAYYPDFFGIWRLSLFDAFFPWAFITAVFWLDGSAAMLLRIVLAAFTISIQPFNAILLVPAYLFGFLRGFDVRRFASYAVMALLILAFIYFTFAQVTFNTIGTGGSGLTFRFGPEEIARAETHPLLVSNLQVSFENLGPLVVLLCLSTLASVAYLTIKGDATERNMIPILIILALGLLISSGLIYLGESFLQYVLKMRYTVLLIFVFPLTYLLSLRLFERYRAVGAILIIILIMLGLGNLATIGNMHYSGSDPRDGVYQWMVSNLDRNKTIMFDENVFGQSMIQHLQMRYMIFPENATSATEAVPAMLSQKENVYCVYKRYGLFDVRYEPPQNEPKKPEYIIWLVSDQQMASFFESNGYNKIHSDVYFAVYEKSA